MNHTYAGKVVAVTGAGSGIGQALAVAVARNGASAAISDVNDAGLAETVRLITAAGGDVHTRHLDVTDNADATVYAKEVLERFGRVHQLYNNACIEHHGDLVVRLIGPAYQRGAAALAARVQPGLNASKDL